VDLKGKNVLITGADGFIGSHLVELILSEGANVRALSYYNSFNFLGWLEDISPNPKLEIVSGDIRDPNFCEKICEGQEIIFNLAALIAIPYSYIAPDSYIDTNIKGALNICQAAKKSGAIKVIQVSTSEVYGSAKYVPIDENHPLQPQSPYSASKIGADNIAMSFYYSFDLPVTIARPFNTYGPRQSARAVIPTIITQIASGMKQIKLGDTSPTRDLNYVVDTCFGLLAIAKAEESTGQVINIGSNFEISIENLFLKIRDIMNADVEILRDEMRIRPINSEVQRLWCDNSKIEKLTGFKPKYSIDKGLKITIDWFVQSNNLSKYKPGIYNV